MSADGLPEFLRARYDEDKRDAPEIHNRSSDAYLDGDCNCDCPAQALAGIAAKRKLLDRYEAMEAGVLTVIGVEAILSEYRRVILPLLALPYDGHPDYREEWRP